MDIRNCTVEFWLENENDCVSLLQEQWDSIPLINSNDLQNLKNNRLVRFRGMIQDMRNPEFYYEKCEVINEITKNVVLKKGKYIEDIDFNEGEIVNRESPKNVMNERHTLAVISVPALNVWVEEIERDHYNLKLHPPSFENLNQNKRKQNLEVVEDLEQNLSEATSPSKKQCINEANNPKSSVSIDHILNFPIAERGGKACLIKIYENSDQLKLNDVCEFIGFLAIDPYLGFNTKEMEDWESEVEMQTHNPSPSLVPRVHCVSWRIMEHNNPLVKEFNLGVEKIGDLKKEVLVILTQLLFGDELAAEYLLYHLISSVYSRVDFTALGKFTLNLSCIPVERIKNYGEVFYKFLELFVPKSHYLPMSLNNMNELPFIPKKDYDSNRLTSGLLQLSTNTHLILDETKLSAGKLNSLGIKSVAALTKVINSQIVEYDFRYYELEYNCDIPVLILSEGKSMLPSDYHIPLKMAEICLGTYEEVFNNLKSYLIQERLNDVRRYLTQVRLGEYSLTDGVHEMIQEEFVKLRKNNSATNAEDLHRLLVITRLICLSEGKNALNEECWKHAILLETARKARLG